MEGKRGVSRWVVVVACAWASVLGAACWGGDAPRVADRTTGSAAVQSARRAEPAARGLSGAVLSDADLAAIASGGPEPAPVDTGAPEPSPAAGRAASPAAAPSSVADAPLPPEVVRALQSSNGRGAIDATHELAISFGDTRREVFETALDAASVLDEPLPPAAPAPETW